MTRIASRIASLAPLLIGAIPLLSPAASLDRSPSMSSDSATGAAILAVNQMTTAALTMEGADSNCGTMRTRDRWEGALEEELKKTVYQPSASEPPSTADHSSPNSYGDYPRIVTSMAVWSKGGAFEFQAYQSYQLQFHRTVQALGILYHADYGWSPALSTSVAKKNLENALSYGFGFYMYQPFTSEQASYRRAILEHRSLAGLQAAPLSELQKTVPGTDPLLSVAIENPDALRLLLQKGVTPDSPNDFGKTPLMYAAQYNELASARLLLKAGADPNAVTVQPFDQCEYRLGTTNVTALDYAARYASAAMMKLLLSHGAVTYIRSVGFGQVAGYPVDWLHRYSAANEGSNPHLNAADLPELERLLRVPAKPELQREASRLVYRAESLYAASKPALALRDLQLALAGDPDNDRAIADLPVIALRMGELGVALQGAKRATTQFKTPAGRAAAWFNEGLACQQAEGRSVPYNGNVYCENGYIPPFVEAWQDQPTPARLAKLTEALRSERHGHCISGTGASAVTYQFVFYNGGAKTHFENVGRVYVLHAADQHIDPRSISWSWGRGEKNLHVIAHFPLGTDTLTVLQTPTSTYFGGNPTIDGKECRL
jgi:ankyrin repeat protein